VAPPSTTDCQLAEGMLLTNSSMRMSKPCPSSSRLREEARPVSRTDDRKRCEPAPTNRCDLGLAENVKRARSGVVASSVALAAVVPEQNTER